MALPKRSALGRGLDALITMDDVATEGSSSISEVELSKIVPNPDQPRREFDAEALDELAASIRELGVIQPISLRKTGGDSYQIIAGERRFRAAGIAMRARESSGCPYVNHCPEKKKICEEQMPAFQKISDGHYVRCWQSGGGL